MRQISGSVGPLSHELYLAPEVRVWAHLADPRPAGSLQRPSGDAELLATDIWTLGVVFWQLLTLHQSKTLGMISVVRFNPGRVQQRPASVSAAVALRPVAPPLPPRRLCTAHDNRVSVHLGTPRGTPWYTAVHRGGYTVAGQLLVWWPTSPLK